MNKTQIIALLEKARGGAFPKRNLANARAVAVALDQHGARMGLDRPHRLAQLLAQLAHESAWFKHDREVWGPTAAQTRYEGRRDLGNTQPGDGKRFMGRGPIQVTGRSNYRQFRDWCRDTLPVAAGTVPDFEADPDAILTDPWEGLAPLWYWTTRKLNRHADQGDIEMITKRINGGLNGYADRIDAYVKIALAMQGFGPRDVDGFQKAAGLAVDGIAGPKTRAAMHQRLLALNPDEPDAEERVAPVTEEKPVVPEIIDEEVKKVTRWPGWLTGLVSGLGGSVSAFLGADWKVIAAFGGVALGGVLVAVVLGPVIVRRIKAVRKAVEA
jgi:putative chitinase